MNRFASCLSCVYSEVLVKSGISEFVESIDGELLYQGSFVSTGLMNSVYPGPDPLNSMVMGSDLDGICLVDAPYGVVCDLLQKFCDEQTWTDIYGGKHSWTVTFKRNLARISIDWVDAEGNDMGSNLKFDMLLVKKTSVVKYVPSCFSGMGEMCTVHESLRGSIHMGEPIELNVNSVDKVKEMMDFIDSFQMARLVFLFLKTIIKAYKIGIPSVALMCAVVGGYNQASQLTKADSDPKCWFCNIVVNSLNILYAFAEVSKERRPMDVWNCDTWTVRTELVRGYIDMLYSCGSDVGGGPYFDVISPFQATLVQKHVHDLGRVLQDLHFCRAEITRYCNVKSIMNTVNLSLMCFLLDVAMNDVTTFDVNAIVDVLNNGGDSPLFQPYVRNAFKNIIAKNAEKEKFTKPSDFKSNFFADEIKKILRRVLDNKFEHVELPAPWFMTQYLPPGPMYNFFVPSSLADYEPDAD